jgi:hypothetical protein
MRIPDIERERWAALYLARLERLCHLEERFVSPPDALDDPRRLVCKAIFATYCECVLLGYKAEAEHLLAAAPSGSTDAPPPRQAGPAR